MKSAIATGENRLQNDLRKSLFQFQSALLKYLNLIADRDFFRYFDLIQNTKWEILLLTILNDLKMKILQKEAKSNIKNPLHTKDLLKFKITGRDGTQWFLIRICSDSIYWEPDH